MPRFFVEDIDTDAGNIIITGDEFYHLKKVLRLNAGDEIIIFDGKGNDFIAKLETLGSKEAEACVQKKLEASSNEPKFKIVLAQGIAKGEKMDFIIQKAAELGVSSIMPFTASRTVPRFKEDAVLKKIERWQKIAIEAAKQCGRSIVPKIESIKDFKEILIGWEGYLKIILWEDAVCMKLKNKIQELKNLNMRGIIVIVGPEGGFSPEEVQEAEKMGFIPSRLFENILRTETASIVMLSIINYEIAD
ncbi:MAG: 16S rRNA (uracil(1498)-N(3))-methyltransferase [Deltaproteobacteria bacterium]|nr:16S rRNA (uracil(1498)-N(3))-methyltransferase [Deltaproteobacteria bacterium]